MSLAILGMGTAVPRFGFSQRDAAQIDQYMGYETAAQRRFMHDIYAHSGVESRHSVVLEASDGPLALRQSFFPPAQDGDDRGPTTAERVAFYTRAAPPIAAAAAREALAAAHVEPASITHLVTASCTGFVAPGVDLALVDALELSRGVERTHVGFMGCHAALNALRVARAFGEADAKARVLLAAVELCSLHHQYGFSPERIVSNALFADGAAALVGRGGGADPNNDGWRLVASGSTVLPESAADMTWQIGDHGFEMTLSRRVPDLIAQNLRPWVESWLSTQHMSLDDVGSWAVHPGGPKILTACREALNLAPDRLSASHEILARYGNMSSPTVLFLLDRLREQRAPLPCVALAFGPGLTIEAALFA